MKNLPENVSFEEYVSKAQQFKAGKIAEEEFKPYRDAFVEENGEILNQYMCSHYNTAAMLTECGDNRFWIGSKTLFFTQYDLGKDPEIEKLLIEIDFLAAEAARTLRGKRLTRCLGILFKVAKNAMSVLDSLHHAGTAGGVGAYASISEDVNIQKTLAVIQENLAQAKAYQQKAAKFSTQKNYLWGSIMGFGLLAIVFMYTRVFNNIDVDPQLEFSMSCLVFYGSLGGGIGALISVMHRLSSGSLNLSTEPDFKTIQLIGVIRPLLGGMFGILVLLLFNSGFSVFSLVAENETRILSNFLILSFIAGFFERFVPDLLDQTQNKILSGEEIPSSAGMPAADV